MSQQDKLLTQNTHSDIHNETFYEINDTNYSKPYKICGIFPHFEKGNYFVRFHPARKGVGEGYVMELDRFFGRFKHKE